MECMCATHTQGYVQLDLGFVLAVKYITSYKHTDQANNLKSDKETVTPEAPTVSQSALTDRQPAALLGCCLWGPGNSWDGKKSRRRGSMKGGRENEVGHW